MRKWGVEDLDLSLKCWLSGHAILHDHKAVIGHRFRTKFENYDAPIEEFLVNQLRMAGKNFTPAVWGQWVEETRQRHSKHLTEYPEGLWARVWTMFEADRASADEERAYHARRTRDEFWYAERFGLAWPRLEVPGAPPPAADDPSSPSGPSPSPPPKKERKGAPFTIVATGVSNPSKDGSEAAKIVPLADVQEGHCIFVGQTLYLTTKDKHPGKPIDPKKLKWSCSGPGGEEGFHHDGEDATLTAGQQGAYTVTAECEGFSAEFTVTACGVAVKQITFDGVHFDTAPKPDSPGGARAREPQYQRGKSPVLVCLVGGEGAVRESRCSHCRGAGKGKGPSEPPEVVGRFKVAGQQVSLYDDGLSIEGGSLKGQFDSAEDYVLTAVSYAKSLTITWLVNGVDIGATSANPLITLCAQPISQPPGGFPPPGPTSGDKGRIEEIDLAVTGRRLKALAGACGEGGASGPDAVVSALWQNLFEGLPIRPRRSASALAFGRWSATRRAGTKMLRGLAASARTSPFVCKCRLLMAGVEVASPDGVRYVFPRLTGRVEGAYASPEELSHQYRDCHPGKNRHDPNAAGGPTSRRETTRRTRRKASTTGSALSTWMATIGPTNTRRASIGMESTTHPARACPRRKPEHRKL